MFQIQKFQATGIVMICCVLAFYGISSCRKDAVEKTFGLQLAPMGDSLLQISAPNGLLIISPAKSDTGFDVNSGIVIKPIAEAEDMDFRAIFF